MNLELPAAPANLESWAAITGAFAGVAMAGLRLLRWYLDQRFKAQHAEQLARAPEAARDAVRQLAPDPPPPLGVLAPLLVGSSLALALGVAHGDLLAKKLPPLKRSGCVGLCLKTGSCLKTL